MSETMEIREETARPDCVLKPVREGMRRHTESQAPCGEYSEVTIVARNREGVVTGVALGEAGRGWLHVSVVWVDEPFRGQGIGRRLMQAAEAAGIGQGCQAAYLDTFSYQARPFYEKLGYEVFGTLDDYPPGHQRHFMRKRLQ
ncbi:MAG TPA: GNAT family N-acetyltransferase [Verrucomicrobiales bacterium]|nr:GNAT family N-acetyltransferase [Verrucomicrobiales bacterium]